MTNDNNVTPTMFGGEMPGNEDPNATVCSSTVGITDAAGLMPGTVFDSRYVIVSRIGGQTSQAQVYTATTEGDSTTVVLKIYSSEYKPDYAKSEIIKKLSSPYLAKLLGYGSCDGRYYEVYTYYKNGNVRDMIKEKAFSEEFVEKVAIPSLNEALNTLHEAGLAHGDLKPENIFMGDDGQSLVLGDYGISVMLNKDGYAFAQLQGTLAYAPKFDQHFNKAKIDRAYDYGSMGFVIIALLCGRGIFDAMSNDEKFVEMEKGVELPGNITGRMKTLVQGLIENDTEKRFGYDEVFGWCRGEIVSRAFKSAVTVQKHINSLAVAIVEGKVINVKTPKDFAVEVLKNWNAAKARIFESPNMKGILKSFLDQFDEKLYRSVASYLDGADKDKIIFYVTYTLYPQKTIYYKGRALGNIEELMDAMHSKEDNEFFIDFIKSDILEFYMRVNDFDKQLADEIDALIEISEGDSEFLYYLIMYSFAKVKVLKLGDKKITSFDELAQTIMEKGLGWVLSDENRNNLHGWLYCKGFGKEVKMMRKRDKR